MKALTKLLSLFLTLCLVLSMAPATAHASEAEAATDLVDESEGVEEIEEQTVVTEVSEEQVEDAAPVAGEEVLVELPEDMDESASAVEEPDALPESPAPTMPAESPSYLFTKQPESGVVPDGENYTISWGTNFMAFRVWLFALEPGMDKPGENAEPLQKFSDEEIACGEAEFSPLGNDLILVAWYGEGSADYIISMPFTVTTSPAQEDNPDDMSDDEESVEDASTDNPLVEDAEESVSMDTFTGSGIPRVLPESAAVLMGDDVVNCFFRKSPKCTFCTDKPAFRISWTTSFVPSQIQIVFDSLGTSCILTENLSMSMYYDLPFDSTESSNINFHVEASIDDTTIGSGTATIPWNSLTFSQEPTASVNGNRTAFHVDWETSFVPTMVEIGYLSDGNFHSVAAYTDDLGRNMTVELSFDSAIHEDMIVRAYYGAGRYADSAAFALPWNAFQSSIISNSVNFEGKLGLNFYVRVSDDLLEDPNAYATISFDGVERTVLISNAPVSLKAGIMRRQFTQDVVAKQMRKPVSLRLYDGKGNLMPLLDKAGEDVTESGFTYSLMAYLDEIIAKSTNEYMVALAAATKNYGTAAQIRFNYDADGLSIAPEVTMVTLNNLAAYAPIYTGSLPSGITKNTSTILFEEDNTLKQYFTLKAGQNVSVYTFMIDGIQVTPTLSETDKYYISLPNISANNLDVVHQFSVVRGAESYSFLFSPLSYVYKIIDESTNQPMIDLAKALFLYNQAANEYFAHKT